MRVLYFTWFTSLYCGFIFKNHSFVASRGEHTNGSFENQNEGWRHIHFRGEMDDRLSANHEKDKGREETHAAGVVSAKHDCWRKREQDREVGGNLTLRPNNKGFVLLAHTTRIVVQQWYNEHGRWKRVLSVGFVRTLNFSIMM